MGVYYFKIYLRREMKVKKAVSGGGPVRRGRVARVSTTARRRVAPVLTCVQDAVDQPSRRRQLSQPYRRLKVGDSIEAYQDGHTHTIVCSIHDDMHTSHE